MGLTGKLLGTKLVELEELLGKFGGFFKTSRSQFDTDDDFTIGDHVDNVLAQVVELEEFTWKKVQKARTRNQNNSASNRFGVELFCVHVYPCRYGAS